MPVRATFHPQINKISVAGDLTIKHMIVEDDPVWESERVSPMPHFRDYSLLVGAFNLEFLLSACSQYLHLTELVKSSAQVSHINLKSTLEDSSRLVDGPSSLALTDEAKKNIPQLHYAVRPTECLSADRKVEKRYRLSARRGRSNTQPIQPPIAQHFSSPKVMALSIDYDCFCRDSYDSYTTAASDFASVEALVMRLAVNPNSDLKGASNIQKFNKNLLGLIKKFENLQVKVAVISAETLRRCGYDVSYRVTWERTISDVVTVLNKKIKKRSDIGSEDWDLRILASFDYVIVTFYNDGALAVPITDDTTQKAIFVADPNSIERDFVSSYSGFTRGSETLVATALAYQLALKQTDFQKLSQKIQVAMIRGLKASRFLQAHGLVTTESNMHLLDQSVAKISAIKKKHLSTTSLGRAMLRIHEQQSTINDCVAFLWNRLLSTNYCKQVSDFLGPSLVDQRPHVWPYGDIVEILVWGYPVYGSFPPTAINREGGRSAISKTCDLTLESWRSAGWLSCAHLPLAEVTAHSISTTEPLIAQSQRSDHDRIWWSFENHAINALAEKVVTDVPAGVEKKCDFVREVLCASIIKYGYSSINVTEANRSFRFDHLFLNLMLGDCTDILRPETRTIWQIVDRKRTIESILGVTNFNVKRRQSFEDALNSAILHSSRKNPDFSNLLEIIPEFKVGKLFTTDRRDSQNYREVRERILNYRLSEDRKPLNLAVFGQAGSGKSFGVKELVRNVFGDKEIEFLEFNVAQFGTEKVLVDAMLEIQNASLQGKMPVAFWDEYDTYKEGIPLGWISYFLGPMQDSAFFLHQRLRYLPRCIFVFAGSMFQSFGEMRLLDKLSTTGIQMEPGLASELEFFQRVGNFSVDDWKKAKGADFKSRLTAVLDISGVNPAQPTKLYPAIKDAGQGFKPSSVLVNLSMPEDKGAFILRRARGIRSAFEIHASELIDPNSKVLSISGSLLERLLHTGTYIHGQRSIENLTKMSSIRGHGQADNSFIPSSGQIRIHADPKLLDENPELRDFQIGHFEELRNRVHLE